MSRMFKVGMVGLLVVGALAVFLVGSALAQEPTPTPHGGFGFGRGFGLMGHGDWSTFDAAAEALGLSPEQLFTELHAGKTLTDLATEKGVDLQAVQETMAAARQEAMQQAIEQAVTDGQISREQADWMLQGIEQGWMGGRGGRGHGWGFKGLSPEGQVQPEGSGFHGRFAMPGQSL